MADFNINNISGDGHIFGNGNLVNNGSRGGDGVLTRKDYYRMLLEIWELGRLSVSDYLEDKYERHISKNPSFVELLYKDVHKVMDGVSKPEDGDIIPDEPWIDDIPTSGHTNNFHDAETWLHLKMVEKFMAESPFTFSERMQRFERDVLEGGHDSPPAVKRLKELNKQLKAERNSLDEHKIVSAPSTFDNMAQNDTDSNPKAFISYAWEDGINEWVKDFATQLRSDGVDVIIDQWQLALGDQLPHFMEQAVRGNDYVLIICTPKYKRKSDNREGGVGYEGDIMTAEVFQRGNHRKYIPILKTGTKETAVPTWLSGKMYVELSSDEHSTQGYKDLLTTLYKVKEVAPPLGRRPAFIVAKQKEASEPIPEEEIRIRGILVDEVTVPRNDGTKGSALYKIPFELNRQPSAEWANLFVQTWNMPPRFTSMHRPGIATVVGKKIILDGTEIDEVERYHRETLKLCVDVANTQYAALIGNRRQQVDQKKKQEEEHRQKLIDANKRLGFE